MKTKLTLKFAKYAMFLLLLAAFNPRLSTWAQGTAFTYQGRLNDGGIPATGNYDLAFTLYSAISGGSPVTGPITNTATAVSNGLFTVNLDFGANRSHAVHCPG